MMNPDFNWFQVSAIPMDAMKGSYNLKLVALSYLIAVLASYVALDLVGRLRLEENFKAKLYWLCGGAFAMGAGIWSMHFIGMLAFILPMTMSYELSWTIFSLLAAILASGLALYILRQKNPNTVHLVLGGILIGIGIATMHYMGMEGMTKYVNIRYLPSLFFLSIGIAIFASEAALWLALQSNQGSRNRQFYLKIISALIMGVAICGMHYTGMTAAVFTPLPSAIMSTETIKPELLAIFIAGITALIISLALTASSYYKQMVDAIQNEKEFLNTMLDNLEDGIIACDADGRITVINDVLQKKINFQKADRITHDFSVYFELYPINSNKALETDETPLYQALRGKSIHAMELKMKLKNGMIRDVIIDGQPIFNTHGNQLGAVIAIHDVTEIKETEKIKREFISVVSHELRTPLTSIRGSLGLLLGGATCHINEKGTKLLDIANKNCERLLLLINDILDMEKVQAGEMKFDLKAVDIDHLVTEAITTNKMYGDKYGVKFKLDVLTPSNLQVYADPDRLLQVLTNLISNAAKFSPPKGIVTLEIKKLNHRVYVSVKDQGPGIPYKFQPRIFQKFAQADSSNTRGQSGTGLGLSISKAIVEKLGGTINFTSKPNEGSVFYFELPIYEQEFAEAQQPIEIAAFIKKILICENDEEQAIFFKQLLEREEIASDIAKNTSVAKKMLSNTQYDALILDLKLPDKNGISFIREVRKSHKTCDLPIIILSMIKQEGQELLNADALLVIDWLEKPVKPNELIVAISRIKQKSEQDLLTILHVEDDPDTRLVVASILEKEANIVPAFNINDAIKKMGKQHFDLVILDIRLPEGSGYDLIPIFAKYQLPIVVYSAFNLDHEFAKQISEALVKSQVSSDDFLNTIKKLLAKMKKHREFTETLHSKY